MIEEDGWYLVATQDSHRQYKHPTPPGRVTVAGHPSHDSALFRGIPCCHSVKARATTHLVWRGKEQPESEFYLEVS